MQGDSCRQGPQNLPQVGTGVFLCNPASLPNRLLSKRPHPVSTWGRLGGWCFILPPPQEIARWRACSLQRGSPAEGAASPKPNPPIPETTPLQSAFSSGDETPHDGGSSHTGGHGRTLGIFVVFAWHRKDTWDSATATPHVPFSVPRDLYDMNLSYPKVFRLF